MKGPVYFLLLLLLLAGCGGGTKVNTPPVDIPFPSGLYQIRATGPADDIPIFRVKGNLTKNGSSMSGILHIDMPACFPFSTDIPATGTLGGDAPDFLLIVTMVLPSGQTLAFSLTHPMGNQSFITGRYTITGPGCAGPPQGGAIVDTFDVTGTWRATFHSKSGATVQMSLALKQTGPDAHGLFSATGTATINGGTCFSSANVDPATLIIGAGSTIVLNNSQPGTTGQTILQGDFGPVVFGDQFFTGSYTSDQGACSDSGTILMQGP